MPLYVNIIQSSKQECEDEYVELGVPEEEDQYTAHS